VFSPEDVDFLEQFNPQAYKIASFEITDTNLISYAAATGKALRGTAFGSAFTHDPHRQ
jgi:pseudaminic acid synthase